MTGQQLILNLCVWTHVWLFFVISFVHGSQLLFCIIFFSLGVCNYYSQSSELVTDLSPHLGTLLFYFLIIKYVHYDHRKLPYILCVVLAFHIGVLHQY